MFTGIRHVKKNHKKFILIEEKIKEAREAFKYCLDTTGEYCDGEPYEVDASKEEQESEMLSSLYEAKMLIEEILKNYGAN